VNSIKIRFSKQPSGVLSLLEIAIPKRRSVLEIVRSLLFELRIQIVRVESIVEEPGLVERFQVVEFDGGPIAGRRAAVIRRAVRRAIRTFEKVA
jgi:hypothetical protein